LKNRSKYDLPIPPMVKIQTTNLTEKELRKIELQNELDSINKTPEQIKIEELEKKLKEKEELLEYKQK